MMENNMKTCGTCEPVKEKQTLPGMEQQMYDVLYKIHDMLGEILTVVSGQKPIEFVKTEPSCLMENVQINLENAKIIADTSYELLEKIKP